MSKRQRNNFNFNQFSNEVQHGNQPMQYGPPHRYGGGYNHRNDYHYPQNRYENHHPPRHGNYRNQHGGPNQGHGGGGHHQRPNYGYTPAPPPQMAPAQPHPLTTSSYNKPDPNFKELDGAAFFIGQLDKTVNRDVVYNEIIRHSKQARPGQGFYVRRMCMPTANSKTGTGNCGFAIIHTRSKAEAEYVLGLGKLRIAGKDCQVQPYYDRRPKDKQLQPAQVSPQTQAKLDEQCTKPGATEETEDSGLPSKCSSSASSQHLTASSASSTRSDSPAMSKLSLPKSVDCQLHYGETAKPAPGSITIPVCQTSTMTQSAVPFYPSQKPVVTQAAAAPAATVPLGAQNEDQYNAAFSQWYHYYMNIGSTMGYDSFYHVYTNWWNTMGYVSTGSPGSSPTAGTVPATTIPAGAAAVPIVCAAPTVIPNASLPAVHSQASAPYYSANYQHLLGAPLVSSVATANTIPEYVAAPAVVPIKENAASTSRVALCV